VGKITILKINQKSMKLLPEKKHEKNAKKRFVIKIIYFYFIFVVFFYNDREIIEKIRKNDFYRKPKK